MGNKIVAGPYGFREAYFFECIKELSDIYKEFTPEHRQHIKKISPHLSGLFNNLDNIIRSDNE